jgi:catechol 2,3-dioxygenase-like lactoylglutathione lyase family enzyme
VFAHVTLRVSDRAESLAFYETILAALGHPVAQAGEVDYWDDFAIAQASATRPATRGLHVAFVTRSCDEVDHVWQTGVDAGYTSDGEPGPRPIYSEQYYGGFLLDPDGNSVEAVYHGVPRTGDAVIDHLWIRVGDLERTHAFYRAIAPALGLTIEGERPERFHVAKDGRSFALVRGEPSANVHVAFPAPDDATVRAFHEAALAAGFRDNGAPGERAYHPGYYAAFVLDPDGNNIEAVNHHGHRY